MFGFNRSSANEEPEYDEEKLHDDPEEREQQRDTETIFGM